MPATDIVLTVAQGKRLIARAMPHVDIVRRALLRGTVVVCKGSTTAYIAEELLGRPIRKGGFILGRVLPQSFQAPDGLWGGAMPEAVFRHGKHLEGVGLADVLDELSQGDVVMKGANALDYRAGLVGHLIGHPTGGTLGTILGSIHGKGAHLVVPVGLEKLVAGDLTTAARRLEETHADTSMPRLWITGGHIVTEIEALRALAQVEAVHVGAGGLCGAEGAVWLRVFGDNDQLERALAVVKDLRDEPSYLEACLAQLGEEGGDGG